MKLTKIVFLLTGLIGVSACTSITTSSSADPTASFAAYKTFSVESKSPLPTPLIREIELALQDELTQRDLTPAKSADLQINFFTLVEDDLRVSETPTSVFVPYRRGYAVWTAYETDLYQVTEGTLFVDIVDTKTKQLVWEGSAHGVVSRGNLERNKAKIAKAIDKMMAALPIPEQGR